MLTIYENKEVFDICYDNENIRHIGMEEFFSKELFHLAEMKQEIYIHNLSFWGPAICLALHNAGYEDIAETMPKNVGEKKFSYTCSRSNGAFYNIRIHECKMFEFLNLCSIEDDQLMETFGGTPSVAMHRCVEMIKSFGTKASTISSAAFAVWKNGFSRWNFNTIFDATEEFGDDFRTRDAYFGGLSYVKPGCEGKRKNSGVVADCNSLYPFVMSNCAFPVGRGNYSKGEPSDSLRSSDYLTYFVRFRAAFTVKPGHMPFLRSKGDEYHNPEEILETSDFIMDGHRYSHIDMVDEETGEVETKRIMVEMTLYKADFELMFEQYDVHKIEYIDYVYYGTNDSIFKDYISRFYEMKKNAKTKGEKRVAKMFMNALSGRMGIKTERENVIFDEKSYAAMNRKTVYGEKQRGKYTNHFMGDCLRDYAGGTVAGTVAGGSFPHIAAAITSEARAYMVRKIQSNWKYFLYTDTDSIHAECSQNKLIGVTFSDEMGDFKIEHTFDMAIYYKSKVYVLYGDRITKKRVYITSAGMPTEVKEVLEQCMDYRMYGGNPAAKIVKPSKEIDNYIWNHFLNEVISGGATYAGGRVFSEAITVHIPRVTKKWLSYSPAKYINHVERVALDLSV